ncbi:uncharacterized protein N7469_010158 [Penicillium citrinum]|uniref:Zn(2)-C6 fungal-type domain-containing protein n=2 Tax=Penicillium TaxID=5073 RepID=A0A9W9TFW6_PENCI|nr:uncharacterized protein N7469_010158 [Penicillium citrinum]KAJ5221271.1 hypothetical protein N7469_010158 [Penicillium citrinum]KAJ5596240.1 hypothetical protein N7450_002698 [Penicillium hetheringtonii]
MDVSPQKQWHCDQCPSIFGRLDHLKRHSLTQNDKEIPDGHQGGKPKHACDSCANIRKACDGEIPCSECIHRARVCTYQRLGEDDRNAAPNTQAKADHPKEVSGSQKSDSKIRTPDEQGRWDLGLQNFYPSSRETSSIVYSRNRYGT